MKVSDYARAVKRVEADFAEDWEAVERLITIGAPVDAVGDVLLNFMRARRRAVWGIASLLLQSCAARKGVTSPMPKYGELRRATVLQWVRECMGGDEVTPANLRGLQQKCVSNIRDCGRGTVAAAASTRFQEYPDKRTEAPEMPEDSVPVESKGEDVEREATEEEIDEIFSRYWDAKDEARPYVEEEDFPAVDGGRPVRKPRGWARVIQGAETCGFCIVMAARAYDYLLYTSEQTALRKDKGGYHRNCDCIAVPVFDLRNWEGKAQSQRAREWYDQHNDKDESWRSARGTV